MAKRKQVAIVEEPDHSHTDDDSEPERDDPRDNAPPHASNVPTKNVKGGVNAPKRTRTMTASLLEKLAHAREKARQIRVARGIESKDLKAKETLIANNKRDTHKEKVNREYAELTKGESVEVSEPVRGRKRKTSDVVTVEDVRDTRPVANPNHIHKKTKRPAPPPPPSQQHANADDVYGGDGVAEYEEEEDGGVVEHNRHGVYLPPHTRVPMQHNSPMFGNQQYYPRENGFRRSGFSAAPGAPIPPPSARVHQHANAQRLPVQHARNATYNNLFG